MAEPQTDLAGGIRVAKGAEPAATEEAAAAEGFVRILTLRERLAAMRTECDSIGKTDIQMQTADRTKSCTIKGHTIEAVLSELRPLFAKYKIDMEPNLVERTYTGNRCDVIVDFTFYDLWPEAWIEDGDNYEYEQSEEITIRWAGAGTDNGDKAFAKAGTNALKEMLKKRFLITDREDAKEETESVQHQAEGGATRQEIDQAKELTRKAIEKAATSLKGALSNAKTVEEITRLERDNKDWLISEELPSVTRAFFVDLIVKRKAELAPAKDA